MIDSKPHIKGNTTGTMDRHGGEHNNAPSPRGGYEALAYAYNNHCTIRMYMKKSDVDIRDLTWLMRHARHMGILDDEGQWGSVGERDWESWEPLDHLPLSPQGRPAKVQRRKT